MICEYEERLVMRMSNDLNLNPNLVPIPKKIHFIWFGSCIPHEGVLKNYWANILEAKKLNPKFKVGIYIDSSLLDENDLMRMRKLCADSGITLVDIHMNKKISKWDAYDLLINFLKHGKSKNCTRYYACASDLFRMMLMIYEGGYYFDTDCSTFPNLDSVPTAPPHGFWQQRDQNDYDPVINTMIGFPYAFQASIPYHAIYILALADIRRVSNLYASIIFDESNTANPLVLNNIDGFCTVQQDVVIQLTGYALYRAMKVLLSVNGKPWEYFCNLDELTVVYPMSDSIIHEGAKSYKEPYEKLSDQDKPRIASAEQIATAHEASMKPLEKNYAEPEYCLSLFNELKGYISQQLVKSLLTQVNPTEQTVDMINMKDESINTEHETLTGSYPMTPESIISNLPDAYRTLPINRQLSSSDERPFITTLVEHAVNTHPIMHACVEQLISDFMDYKREYGTQFEQTLYAGFSVEAMITRLLTKRPLVFMTGNDYTKLRDGRVIADASAMFDAVGQDNQMPDLSLDDYLSYDEMQLSALLGVSSPSAFINDGNRNNKGNPAADATYERTGIITGLVGARFERSGRMEWQHMLITPEQNTQENGYGQSATIESAARMQGFANLYARMGAVEGLSYGDAGYRFPSYHAVTALEKTNKLAFDEKFIRIPGKGILNKHVYKARMRLVIEPFLIDANLRAQTQKCQAYVHAVGLGIGVWALDANVQAHLMVETYQEIIRDNVLSSISDIDFSWFPPLNTYVFSDDEVVTDEHNQIKLHFSQRSPQAKLKAENEGKLSVSMYAWDSNAFPGNEYWVGQLSASGDPAAACNSQIVLLHSSANPFLTGTNKRVLGEMPILTQADYALDEASLSVEHQDVDSLELKIEIQSTSITFRFQQAVYYTISAEDADSLKLRTLINVVERISKLGDLKVMECALSSSDTQHIFSSLHDRGKFSLRGHEWRTENCRQTWARLMQFMQIKSVKLACVEGGDLPEFAAVATKYIKRSRPTSAQVLFQAASQSSSSDQLVDNKLTALSNKLVEMK